MPRGEVPLHARSLSARLRTAAILAVLLAASSAAAQTITRGPYMQNPQDLPTSATIEWWTDVVGDSTVEYGTTPSLGSTTTVAQTGSCEVGSAGTCHIVPLTGLTPGTKYYYQLKTNGTVVQNVNYFTTMRTPADPARSFSRSSATGGRAPAARRRSPTCRMPPIRR